MKRHQRRWAMIPGYPDYAISDDGLVASFKGNHAHYLKPYKHPDGYLQVTLCSPGKETKRYVHRLILEAFIGPAPIDERGEPYCADHLDFDRTHNTLSNLRWLPRSLNSARTFQRNLTDAYALA